MTIQIKKSLTVDILKHVKPNKDCELCDTLRHVDMLAFLVRGDQVKEKYPNAYKNDEGIWELKEKNKNMKTFKITRIDKVKEIQIVKAENEDEIVTSENWDDYEVLSSEIEIEEVKI